VVDQLHVRAVLSVPVQLDGRPVGTLDVPCHQPRPGREELMALGAFATPTAELVRTGVELISRDLEMAQLRQAVISGIWVEQAKAERVAALAIDDARVRAAEARAQAAEHALQAARTELARRIPALDRAQDDADARERAADQRDHLADERDRASDQRQRAAGRDD
jgi:hypothetical protein